MEALDHGYTIVETWCWIYHEVSPPHVHPEGEGLLWLKEDDGAGRAVRMPQPQLFHCRHTKRDRTTALVFISLWLSF
jgi:hypothetical protein